MRAEKGKFMEARIILTHTCNFNCWFCHGEGWAEKKSDFIKKEKLFYLIDQLNKEFKLTNITLSGGEPLLHPEIEEIINFILDKHIKVSLVTNGALIKRYISKLAKVDLINLSIHTLNPLIYEVNSRNKITLEEAVSNIEVLQSYYPEKDIRINIVI